MADTTWQTVAIYVGEADEKVKQIPPPPRPDDEWAMLINALGLSMQRVTQYIMNRVEMEQEAEARENA